MVNKPCEVIRPINPTPTPPPPSELDSVPSPAVPINTTDFDYTQSFTTIGEASQGSEFFASATTANIITIDIACTDAVPAVTDTKTAEIGSDSRTPCQSCDISSISPLTRPDTEAFGGAFQIQPHLTYEPLDNPIDRGASFSTLVSEGTSHEDDTAEESVWDITMLPPDLKTGTESGNAKHLDFSLFWGNKSPVQPDTLAVSADGWETENLHRDLETLMGEEERDLDDDDQQQTQWMPIHKSNSIFENRQTEFSGDGQVLPSLAVHSPKVEPTSSPLPPPISPFSSNVLQPTLPLPPPPMPPPPPPAFRSLSNPILAASRTAMTPAMQQQQLSLLVTLHQLQLLQTANANLNNLNMNRASHQGRNSVHARFNVPAKYKSRAHNIATGASPAPSITTPTSSPPDTASTVPSASSLHLPTPKKSRQGAISIVNPETGLEICIERDEKALIPPAKSSAIPIVRPDNGLQQS